MLESSGVREQRWRKPPFFTRDFPRFRIIFDHRRIAHLLLRLAWPRIGWNRPTPPWTSGSRIAGTSAGALRLTRALSGRTSRKPQCVTGRRKGKRVYIFRSFRSDVQRGCGVRGERCVGCACGSWEPAGWYGFHSFTFQSFVWREHSETST